ncbi:TIGR03854 family LLM class F420-dependent oxidoreductase [Geodermatophilus sp. URMC 64]
MKIRIGLGLSPLHPDDDFATVVERVEDAGIDSLWLSEQIQSAQVEPMIGLAHAAARTTRLKVGTSVTVLPGRHPALVAKQVASLAWLAPRRILPVFGLQPFRPADRVLFPVPGGRRGAVLDEAMLLVRLLLEQPTVTFHGEFFAVDEMSIGPLPSRPLDLWLGGSAAGALRRVGRLADGWLGSMLTPDESSAAVSTIAAAAAEAGRAIEPDHYGMSLRVVLDDAAEKVLAETVARRPDVDPLELVALGWAGARELVSRYVEAGVSKFVVRPASHPGSWERFATDFSAELSGLEN